MEKIRQKAIIDVINLPEAGAREEETVPFNITVLVHTTLHLEFWGSSGKLEDTRQHFVDWHRFGQPRSNIRMK